jgi:MFS family permease
VIGRAARRPGAPAAGRSDAAERWRVVAALFTVTVCVSTCVSAFGVFLPVLSDAFGWRRGAISLALTINLVLGGVAAFAVAAIAERHGPRLVLLLTVLIGAAGFALASTIDTLWQFYLAYGVMVGIGMSSIFVLSTAIVARWFVRGRGIALAVVLSGFNLGWLLGGPLAAFLIRHWGWRAAYVILAGIVAGIAVPATSWVRYPDGDRVTVAPAGAERGRLAPVHMSLGDALGDWRLWLLWGAWFCMGLAFMTVTVHSVPFARDRGLPLERAALALTAYGFGAAVGRLVSGAVADRFGTMMTMYVCLAAQAGALAVLVGGPPTWALTAVLVVFGMGAAGSDNSFVKVVPDVFGLGALASVMSVLGLGWRSGAGLGPAGAGFLYDLTGSYTVPFAAALLVLGLGAVGTRHVPGRPQDA